MDNQVLVVYATKYGATAEIAEKIGQVLRQASLQANALPADRIRDLSPYKAVALGSAVYYGVGGMGMPPLRFSDRFQGVRLHEMWRVQGALPL